MAKIKAKIKALLMDVDGVLTDGGMYYSEDGREWKKFNTRDGHGIKLLQEKGFKIGLVTKEKTDIVSQRARKLDIKDVYQGALNKVDALKHFCTKHKLSPEEVAYIGDDVIDVGIMRKVGLPIAVQDALPEVKAVARIITEKEGGEGAVREVCDLLIKIK